MLIVLWVATITAKRRQLLALNNTAALRPDTLVREYWKLAQENDDLLRTLRAGAQSAGDHHTHHHQSKRHYRLLCDVTRGQWQRHERDPLPQLDTCVVSGSSSACSTKTAQLYRHLWWVPMERDCHVPLPIGSTPWLRANKHVKLALVGDSILRSIFYSLPCILGKNAPSLTESQQEITVTREDMNASFRADMLWSPLLTAGQREQLTPNIPGGWGAAVKDYDLVVIGVGPHFNYETGVRAEAVRRAGYNPQSRASRERFLRDSLYTSARALLGFTGTVLVLGYPNDYRMLPNGSFSSKGDCEGDWHNKSLRFRHTAAYQNAPHAASSLSTNQLSSFNIGEEIYQAFSRRFHTIHVNLHDMYAGRFDAHMGRVSNTSQEQDCIHWCTGSGVPEVILGIVYELMFGH